MSSAVVCSSVDGESVVETDKHIAVLAPNRLLLSCNALYLYHLNSLTGNGSTAKFTVELFEKCMEVVKALCENQEHHGIDVLRRLQCGVTKLSDPPGEQ